MIPMKQSTPKNRHRRVRLCALAGLVFLTLFVTTWISACSDGGDSITGEPPCNRRSTKPDLVYFQEPEYPPTAIELQLQGTVIVAVRVLTDGTVGDAYVFQSRNSILDEAAIEAARLCIWNPATQHCFPVPTWILQAIDFELE